MSKPLLLSESAGAVAGDTTGTLAFEALSPELVEEVWKACVVQKDWKWDELGQY